MKKTEKLSKLWLYIKGHCDAKLWQKINEAVDLELKLKSQNTK